jgi:nitroimidazol reductase NimA-like FMN-containing flavoprotein (pyridoxamine 5'-phosphate oxidase superfamily)
MSVPVEVAEHVAGAALSASLATSVDDRPHVAPVWYVYEDESLWVLTGGKKLANVRRNPRVAVAIEKGAGDDVAWGVSLLGTAAVVDDDDRIAEIQQKMDGIYHGEDADESVADVPADVEWALIEIDVGTASLQVY